MDTNEQRRLIQQHSHRIVLLDDVGVERLRGIANNEIAKWIRHNCFDLRFVNACIVSKLCTLELQRRQSQPRLLQQQEEEAKDGKEEKRTTKKKRKRDNEDDDDGKSQESVPPLAKKRRLLQKDLVERFIHEHLSRLNPANSGVDDDKSLSLIQQQQPKKGRKGETRKKKQEKARSEAAPACPITASNYVCTFSFRREIDIALIQRLFPGQINGEGLRSLHIAIRDPRLTVQIFRTGTVVIAGARTAEIARFGAHLLAYNLSLKLKTELRVYGFVVCNIVAFGALGFRIDRLKLFRDKGAVVADDAEAPPVADMSRRKGIKELKRPLILDGGDDGKQEDYYYGLALRFDDEDSDNEGGEDEKSNSNGLPKKVVNAGTRRRAKWRGREWCEWHPEQFGGVDYYPCYPKAIIVFEVGTFVATGTNDPKEIVEMMNAIPDWTKYRLDD
jgi:TATA-box binding protein (TBP) (component of TFIID and TFIIIB)